MSENNGNYKGRTPLPKMNSKRAKQSRKTSAVTVTKRRLNNNSKTNQQRQLPQGEPAPKRRRIPQPFSVVPKVPSSTTPKAKTPASNANTTATASNVFSNDSALDDDSSEDDTSSVTSESSSSTTFNALSEESTSDSDDTVTSESSSSATPNASAGETTSASGDRRSFAQAMILSGLISRLRDLTRDMNSLGRDMDSFERGMNSLGQNLDSFARVVSGTEGGTSVVGSNGSARNAIIVTHGRVLNVGRNVPLQNKSQWLSSHTVAYTYEKPKASASAGPDLCCVCIEQFRKGDPVTRLQCLHIFHRNCIDDYIFEHKKCPICRAVFSY